MREATGRRTRAQEDGGEAEAQAAAHLAAQGLAILHRNYRTRLGEIDLVARDGPVLVFVEVRRRESARFGGAAGSVDGAKQRKLIRAARCYLARLRSLPPCRFDVVTVHEGRIAWLRGAFDAS